jgi:hypothetical protein
MLIEAGPDLRADVCGATRPEQRIRDWPLTTRSVKLSV